MGSPWSLLQAAQLQLSRPFLTGEELHPPEHLHSPPLDLLQQAHVLKVPELDTVLQVRSHQRVRNISLIPINTSHGKGQLGNTNTD